MVTTVNTYNQEKLREDVSNIVFNISPVEVPFQSSCRVSSAHNRTIEWTTDELAPTATNALVEGADTSTASDTPAVSVQNNYCQIFSKVAINSATSDAVDFYGRSSELAYNLSKKASEIKRDYEAALVGLKQAGAVGDAVTARELKSFQTLAGTTLDNGAVARALDEADYLTLLQTMYEKGADPSSTLITPAHAQIVSSWASSGAGGATPFQGRRKNIDNKDRSINHAVDFYISPYGQTMIMIDRFKAADDLLVYDNEYIECAYLRRPSLEKLAKTGDSERRLLVMEASLKLNSLDAGGVLADLTATGL